MVEAQAVRDFGALSRAEIVDVFALGAEIIDRCGLLAGSPVIVGVLESAHKRQVFPENIGEQGHEQVVEGFESTAEGDRLGHRDVGLDFKMLGVDRPGR